MTNYAKDDRWRGLLRPDAAALQFACGPTASASRGWIVDLCGGYNITDTHLYLQVTIRLLMIVCEEHQTVMGNDVGFIRMAGEHHLATNCLLGSSNGYLFTVLAEDEFLRFTAHIAVRPEHERDHASLEALLTQALTEV